MLIIGISVADPDPGSGAFFDHWIRDPGWVRRQHPGSGMNNPDHIFLELRNHFFGFFGVKILKFFDADPGSGSGFRDGDSSDPGSGMEKSRIRDPGKTSRIRNTDWDAFALFFISPRPGD